MKHLIFYSMSDWKIFLVLFVYFAAIQNENQNCNASKTSTLDSKLSTILKKGPRKDKVESMSKLKGIKTRKVKLISTIMPLNHTLHLNESFDFQNEPDPINSVMLSNSSMLEGNDGTNSSEKPIELLKSTILDINDGENSTVFPIVLLKGMINSILGAINYMFKRYIKL